MNTQAPPPLESLDSNTRLIEANIGDGELIGAGEFLSLIDCLLIVFGMMAHFMVDAFCCID
jgi:hypothetical protein